MKNKKIDLNENMVNYAIKRGAALVRDFKSFIHIKQENMYNCKEMERKISYPRKLREVPHERAGAVAQAGGEIGGGPLRSWNALGLRYRVPANPVHSGKIRFF
jgi:hypothetical protein